MATPAQIANDLDARAKLLERTQMADHARAMRRGANVIRDLSNALAGELEELAELVGQHAVCQECGNGR